VSIANVGGVLSIKKPVNQAVSPHRKQASVKHRSGTSVVKKSIGRVGSVVISKRIEEPHRSRLAALSKTELGLSDTELTKTPQKRRRVDRKPMAKVKRSSAIEITVIACRVLHWK
jgi:hypothetical protein